MVTWEGLVDEGREDRFSCSQCLLAWSKCPCHIATAQHIAHINYFLLDNKWILVSQCQGHQFFLPFSQKSTAWTEQWNRNTFFPACIVCIVIVFHYFNKEVGCIPWGAVAYNSNQFQRGLYYCQWEIPKLKCLLLFFLINNR